MPVFSRTSARSAIPSPARAASHGRSVLRRVTARTVLPVAAAGGLAALSIAAPAASVVVPAASAATQVASAKVVPDVSGPVFKSRQFPAPQTIATVPGRPRDQLLHAGAVPGRATT